MGDRGGGRKGGGGGRGGIYGIYHSAARPCWWCLTLWLLNGKLRDDGILEVLKNFVSWACRRFSYPRLVTSGRECIMQGYDEDHVAEHVVDHAAEHAVGTQRGAGRAGRAGQLSIVFVKNQSVACYALLVGEKKSGHLGIRILITHLRYVGGKVDSPTVRIGVRNRISHGAMLRRHHLGGLSSYRYR